MELFWSSMEFHGIQWNLINLILKKSYFKILLVVFDWWLYDIRLKSHGNATYGIGFSIVIRILNTPVLAKKPQGQRKWRAVWYIIFLRCNVKLSNLNDLETQTSKYVGTQNCTHYKQNNYQMQINVQMTGTETYFNPIFHSRKKKKYPHDNVHWTLSCGYFFCLCGTSFRKDATLQLSRWKSSLYIDGILPKGAPPVMLMQGR